MKKVGSGLTGRGRHRVRSNTGTRGGWRQNPLNLGNPGPTNVCVIGESTASNISFSTVELTCFASAVTTASGFAQ